MWTDRRPGQTEQITEYGILNSIPETVREQTEDLVKTEKKIQVQNFI